MPREERQRDDVAAGEAPVGGVLRCGRQLAVGESVELGGIVEHDGQVVGVGQ